MSEPPRRIGNRAVNKAQDFFEEHDMIFQRVSQENDIGVDALLTIARSGPDAGLSVRLQIKGGKSYKGKLHIDARYLKRGMASYRSVDWKLWKEVRPPQGFEGWHIVDMDSRLQNVWRNSRPIYIIVQDADDGELYWGNLAIMADVEPLDQDLAESFTRLSTEDKDDSPFYKHLESIHKRVSRLNERQLGKHKTWIPLYPDLQLTPDGLEGFMNSARALARYPMPDPERGGDSPPLFVRYADGHVGLSREALEARRRGEAIDY